MESIDRREVALLPNNYVAIIIQRVVSFAQQRGAALNERMLRDLIVPDAFTSLYRRQGQQGYHSGS